MKLAPDTEAYRLGSIKRCFADKVTDLAGVHYEPEFDFWKVR